MRQLAPERNLRQFVLEFPAYFLFNVILNFDLFDFYVGKTFDIM